jgi:hypothetical protein
MADEILDEIWRVRAELLKEYGGLEGYFRHIQKLDRAHRRREQQRKVTSAKKKTPRSRTSGR